jgi:putative CocE/NonD family hydrolase
MRLAKRILRWIAAGLGLLALLAAGTVLTAGLLAPDPRTALTPGGQRQNVSIHVKARDGVKLAVDRWLPPNHAGDKIPTIVLMTRYWRALERTLLYRGLAHLGLVPPRDMVLETWAERFLLAGYAVVAVDCRGSGGSDGEWLMPYGRQEIADFAPVFDWVVGQPWSNGRIATYGVSYTGTTAELAATTQHPALKAVVPSFVYWDLIRDVLAEGGIKNQWLLDAWSAGTRSLDHDEVCMGDRWCQLKWLTLIRGVKRVDVDGGGSQLADIVRRRHNRSLADGMASFQFRDDRYGQLADSLDATHPAGRAGELARSDVAYYVMTGWYDAGGASGALARFRTLPNQQDLIIGPWSHGASFHTDPFLADDTPVTPSSEAQFQRLLAFLDAHLKAAPPPPRGPDAPRAKRVVYYVNGASLWRTAGSWPPEGYPLQRHYLAADHTLDQTQPALPEASDRYQVDFSATTGARSRLRTTLGGGDVVYPDRRDADRHLLTYDSKPLPRDMELTGTAVVQLEVASTALDCAFHVYLEDVGPDGRVTYLTEGRLRALHRRPQPEGALHSLRRADTLPLRPGEPASVRVELNVISARIRQGHRLRVAVGGHDASGLQRVPANGVPVFTVHRSAARPSFVELPMQPFSPAGGLPGPPP